MADIFISYAREDSTRVRPLAEALSDQGWTVWWDLEIRSGQRFSDVIQTELNKASCVLVVWSEHSIKSEWVQNEADVGRQQNMLIPVLVDHCTPPLAFRQIQTANLNNWQGDTSESRFKKLIQDVGYCLGKEADVESAHLAGDAQETSQPVQRSYRAFYVTAGLLLLAVALLMLQIPDDPKQVVIGQDNKEMVLIAGGPFEMGADSTGAKDFSPKHTVTLEPFYIDKYAVTNSEYMLFAAEKPEHQIGPNPACHGTAEMLPANHPVCGVSWTSADAYCRWAGKQLPTEAQWEKAARGTDARMYPWGHDRVSDEQVNFCDRNCDLELAKDVSRDDGFPYAAPVDAFPNGASQYGAFNMAGNVWEWVRDWYGPDYYEGSPANEPSNIHRTGNSGRVVRGGSWASQAKQLRTYYRTWRDPKQPNEFVGIRCVASET